MDITPREWAKNAWIFHLVMGALVIGSSWGASVAVAKSQIERIDALERVTNPMPTQLGVIETKIDNLSCRLVKQYCN